LRLEFQILRLEFQILRLEFQILRLEFQILRLEFQILRLEFQILRLEFQIIKNSQYFPQMLSNLHHNPLLPLISTSTAITQLFSFIHIQVMMNTSLKCHKSFKIVKI